MKRVLLVTTRPSDRALKTSFEGGLCVSVAHMGYRLTWR